MQDPTIHRINFEGHFTTLSNISAEDPTISWAAKGLLWYLISRPATWKINRKHLSKIYQGPRQNNGPDAIDSMFNELIEQGYVVYKKQDPKSGKMVHRYDVYPVKHSIFQKMFPEPDNPAVDNPCQVEPAPIVNNDLKQSNESSKSNIGSSAAAPSLDIDPEAQRRFDTPPDENPFLKEKAMGMEAWSELSKVGLTDKEISDMKKNNPQVPEQDWIRAAKHSINRKGEKKPGWYVQCAKEKWWQDEHTDEAKDAHRDSLRQKYAKLDMTTFQGFKIVVGPGYIEFSSAMSCQQFQLAERDCEAKMDKWLEKKGMKEAFYGMLDGKE